VRVPVPGRAPKGHPRSATGCALATSDQGNSSSEDKREEGKALGAMLFSPGAVAQCKRGCSGNRLSFRYHQLAPLNWFGMTDVAEGINVRGECQFQKNFGVQIFSNRCGGMATEVWTLNSQIKPQLLPARDLSPV
jgi:hypothetical protein